MTSTFFFATLLAAANASPGAAAFRQGSIEYDLGHFDAARRIFEELYRDDPSPEILFNLGQCERKLGHWERAAFFYRGYLHARPAAGNRAATEAFIAEMERKIPRPEPVAPPGPPRRAAAAPSPPPPPARPAPPAAVSAAVVARPQRQAKRPAGPWWLGGFGAGGLAAGAAIGGVDLYFAARDAPVSCPGGSGLCHGVTLGEANFSHAASWLAPALLVTGGALLVSSIGWALFSSPSPASRPP